MGFFVILLYLSGYLALILAAICLASGLYYLANLAEEHSVATKAFLKYSAIIVIIFHVLLWLIDDFPLSRIALGIAAHLAYMSMLNTFPDVSLRSISFISSIVLLFLDNYVWYRFFSLTFYHSTNEMMGFLLICVWFVPSGFILSISLSDEVLPGISNSFGANSSDEQFRGSAENPKFTILQKLSVKSLLELLKWRSRKPLLPDSNLNQQFAPESNLQAQYPPQFGGAPFRHPSMGMPAPTIGHRRGYHPEKYN